MSTAVSAGSIMLVHTHAQWQAHENFFLLLPFCCCPRPPDPITHTISHITKETLHNSTYLQLYTIIKIKIGTNLLCAYYINMLLFIHSTTISCSDIRHLSKCLERFSGRVFSNDIHSLELRREQISWILDHSKRKIVENPVHHFCQLLINWVLSCWEYRLLKNCSWSSGL